MKRKKVAVLFPHKNKAPELGEGAFIAPGAIVLSDVALGDCSSVWFNAVVRGDVNAIRIGRRTNIQDLSVVHVTSQCPTIVGDEVTVGHSVILHGCKIGDRVLIGMGSIVLDGAEIGDNVILGAGSLVTPGTRIPPGTKAFGRPAKVVGQLSGDEKAHLKASAERYVQLALVYLK